MKKQPLHQRVIVAAVCISLFSFVYVNFLSDAAGAVRGNNPSDAYTLTTQSEEKEEASTRTPPNVAVLGYLLTIAQKFVPSGR